MKETLLNVKHLTLGVTERDGSVNKAVDDISFEVRKGEILGIVGESGCGKSLTVMTLMGLMKDDVFVMDGQILFGQDDLVRVTPERRRQINGNDLSIIYQEPMTSLNPLIKIGRQVGEPLRLHRKDLSEKEIDRMVLELLTEVGIQNPGQIMKSYPHQLSGGMRQRVMIAMASICRPRILVADEPTTALDVTTQAHVLSLLKRVNEEFGTTILFISHDLGVINRVCDRVRQALKKLEGEDPGVIFDISYDAGTSITDALKSVAETLIIGVLLAMVVLFVFFGDWKASLIVGSSMPLSVLATLICMYLFGFNLNIITTGALVIAIGMIVDNSIVVIESCFRIREEVEDRREAAIKGAGVVSMSIFASTLTTCVVYLPLSLMSVLSCQMFSQLGMIIVFAMAASLIMALTIVPLLYVKVDPTEKKENTEAE